jgi:hypothetical protein
MYRRFELHLNQREALRFELGFVCARHDEVGQMLHSIADDLWVAEQPLRYLGVALTTRMTNRPPREWRLAGPFADPSHR